MARQTSKRRRQENELKEKGYIECAYCSELVNPKALKCEHCGKWYSSGKQVITISLVLIIALCLVSVYYLYPTDGQGAYIPPDDVPTVLSASPTGLSVSTISKISVTFNRDMNKASVESAFTISPSVPGSFTWNDRTLLYTPTGSLSEGTIHTVTIGSTAVDITGLYLDCGMYSWQFTTSGAFLPATCMLASWGISACQCMR
jgi:hypothetical protein